MTEADAERRDATDAGRRPLASVIVLGWNGREYIEPCLASVLDQDLPREQYEVLYADNGSRDGSADFVRERFPDLRVLEFARNHGYAEGNNLAYKETRGEFAVFLNQDTVVHRSWLRELIAAVEASPQIAAAHANIVQPWYPEFAGIAQRADVEVAYTSDVNRLGYIAYRRLPSMEPVDTLFLHGVC
ncbi:MAG: glycosyltransferase, partial [Dehalococcoidia bacterium]